MDTGNNLFSGSKLIVDEFYAVEDSDTHSGAPVIPMFIPMASCLRRPPWRP